MVDSCDNSAVDTCDRCGAVVRVGDYPFCPHGTAKPAIVTDDIPGGQWFENGLTTPQKFYSKSDHRKAVEANGCEIRPYWVPNDKHLTNWAAVISPHQLEAAREMLSRPKRRRVELDTSIQARVEWEDPCR